MTINDEYCWTGTHPGGWECATCTTEKELELLEQAVLEAAEKATDNLLDLLQEAIEKLDEQRADRLLVKVHQVQSENLRDLRGWK